MSVSDLYFRLTVADLSLRVWAIAEKMEIALDTFQVGSLVESKTMTASYDMFLVVGW